MCGCCVLACVHERERDRGTGRYSEGEQSVEIGEGRIDKLEGWRWRGHGGCVQTSLMSAVNWFSPQPERAREEVLYGEVESLSEAFSPSSLLLIT